MSIQSTLELKIAPCTKTRPEKDLVAINQDLLENPDKVRPFLTIKKKKRATSEEFYVDPKEFADCIKKYYETEDSNCRNYEKLGEAFIKISKGLSSSASFARYSWKEDMIGEALAKMVKALKGKKFSFEYGSSPFSYFTQIAYWAFVAEMKSEKKQHETVKRYRDVKYGEQFEGSESGNVYVKPDSDNEIFHDE